MDPELLQQLFAQQDATANPPRSSEGGSAGGIMELLGMVGENVALGQDPTGLSSPRARDASSTACFWSYGSRNPCCCGK